MVSATFAVARNKHVREVEIDLEVVITERVVLRGVEHLEQRARRVTTPVGTELVDLVEEHDGVHGPGFRERADDPARPRADVRAPVTTQLGLVADTTE